MAEEIPEDELKPLVYQAKKLRPDAPFRWLRKGWQDLRRAPAQSLSYGVGLTVFAWLVTWLAWGESNTMMLFTLGTAFVMGGPVLAFGLYSISRQLEQGLKPRIGYCMREGKKHLRNEMLFALVILVVLLVWARAASMVHVFVPIEEELGVWGWVQFLGIGSAVGSIFAAIVFAASAFSLPLMLDKETDAITGALTSTNAVLRNKPVMLIWAALILVLMLVGVATAFVGLAIVLPWIGHATWHAYRETIIHEDPEDNGDRGSATAD